MQLLSHDQLEVVSCSQPTFFYIGASKYKRKKWSGYAKLLRADHLMGAICICKFNSLAESLHRLLYVVYNNTLQNVAIKS